jgi:hypothetical protein
MSKKPRTLLDEIRRQNAECNAEIVSQAKSDERERIIKLLEAWLADDNGDFNETLALIKGENE